jgi:phosphatidylserine/phosphatidylglycerophosphate/cardiolipin synthase-like enzyme
MRGLALLMVLLSIAASACGQTNSVDEPPIETLFGSNAVPRAFVKDRQIRLGFTNAGHHVALKAEWKNPRVPSKDFSFATATLEPAKRTSEKLGRSWGEVKVLSASESTALIRRAANRLTPVNPGSGILCHYAFGDAVLYRDAAGDVEVHAGDEPAAGFVIERRYNRQDLASIVATTIETDLRATYPGLTAAVIIMGSDHQTRFALLDFAQRKIVVLYLPREGDAVHVTHLGSKLSAVASIILVDHVWAFVKNPVSSVTRTLNQFTQWPLTFFSHRLGASSTEIPPLSHAPGMDLVLWERWLDLYTHTPREKGSLKLLIDGDRFYPLLEQRVAEARSNVDFHVCIFDVDDVAVGLADRLKQRSTNVEVNVVFDRMLSRGAAAAPPATLMRQDFVPPGSIATYLREDSKVHVRPQPNPGFTADHSKVYLIDGRYAYVGGMNLGREYRYEWHDMMAEVQGPVVASLQRQFDKKWAQVGIWGDCGLAVESLQKKKSGTECPTDDQLIELRRLYTKTFHREIRKAELAAIKRASSYIYVENAYFFDNNVLVALAGARRRGVDVRVIMPSENDFGPGHKSNLVVANYLLGEGVRVYFYPGMTHIKALLADGWACFGSANFDALSLRLNREADLATSDAGFVNKFKSELFEADFPKCRELTEALAVDYSDYLADTLLAPF